MSPVMDDFEALDLYEVLGVPRDATGDEIDTAYDRVLQREHPDKSDHPDASARVRKVYEAGKILRDPERRQRYDSDRDRRQGEREAQAQREREALQRERKGSE